MGAQVRRLEYASHGNDHDRGLQNLLRGLGCYNPRRGARVRGILVHNFRFTTFHPAADCPGQTHVLQLSNSWWATTEVKFNSLYLYNLNTTGTGITSSTSKERNHQHEASAASPQAENSRHPWTESPAH